MIRKISYCGILAAVALVISSLERYVPLHALIPLPGIKLGLSNCIILFIIRKIDCKSAIAVLILKCFIASLLFGGPISLVYSLCGGLFAVVGMCITVKFERVFSIFGVSVFGAAMHQIGQICAASVMLKSTYVFSYLPFLLIASVITGLITGAVSKLLCERVVLK